MSEEQKDALLRRAWTALHGTKEALDQILQDDDDIVLSQSVIGGFMEDDQIARKRKPEFYQQLGPDYIAQLRKETFAKVAGLSGRGEGTVMRFFERIKWKGDIEVTPDGPRRISPEAEMREALYPPLPKEFTEVDVAAFFGKDAKSQEEHDARTEKNLKRKIAQNEAETQMKRIVFLLRDLHAQSAAEASLARQAEARKQQRLRSARFLMRPYGEEVQHV